MDFVLVLASLLGFLGGVFGTTAPAVAEATIVAQAAPPEMAPNIRELIGGSPAGETPSAGEGADLLFGDLVDRLLEVSDVVVTTDRYAMTIGLRDNVWVAVDSNDYPVRQDAVPSIFLNLTFLVAGEMLPDDPTTYAALGVAEPGAEGGGKRFTVLTASGEVIEDVIVGIAAETEAVRGGVYIRRVNTGEIWLARGAVEFPTYPSEWFDAVVSYRLADIARVEVLRGETSVFAATKADATDFALDYADPAIGGAAVVANSRAIRVLGQAVSSTFFDAVRPAGGIVIPADAQSVRFEMVNALTLTATLVPVEGAIWVVYAAAAPDGSVGAAAAAAITARTSGWMFQLPASRILLLGTNPSTLVQAP